MVSEASKTIVKLNVGGHTYYTYQEVLIQSQFFKNMLEGDMTNLILVNKENIFIDRCGILFDSVLHYLRTGYPLTGGKFKLEKLIIEAEYYQLEGLLQKIDEIKKNREKKKQNPLFKTMDIKELTSANTHTTHGYEGVDDETKKAQQDTWQVIKVVDTKCLTSYCWKHNDRHEAPSICSTTKELNVTTPILIVKKDA